MELRQKKKKFTDIFVSSDNLLEEVLFLVEYPTVFTGSFKKDYLKIT